MKQTFTTLLFVFIAATSVLAQANKGLGKSDPEAKKILDEVSAKFKTYRSVKANFTLKVENAAGKAEVPKERPTAKAKAKARAQSAPPAGRGKPTGGKNQRGPAKGGRPNGGKGGGKGGKGGGKGRGR